MNAVLCGAGAFGRNHLRVYRELELQGYPVHLSAVVEPDSGRAQALETDAKDHSQQISIFSDLRECMAARDMGRIAIDVASVCAPTSAHFSIAAELLAAGLDVLVEKPIAATVNEANRLIELAQQHGRILQVGQLERFNPAITAIEPYLDNPMFFEVHRLSVFSPRSLDVDVVLDLMIHDLDIVLTFTQSPIRHLHAVGLPVVSGKVDIASVRIEFESGCVANFTASRVSTERVRKMRFFQPHQYVSVDYARQDLFVIDVETRDGKAIRQTGENNPADPVAFGGRESHLPPGLSLRRPVVHSGEPLRLEIESFLNAVKTRTAPRVSGEDGRRALALAIEINEAIAMHAKHASLQRFAPGG
ncbi:Gfo/Idh/MocA family protein [Paracidobacterium acidisoli]|uniref:Gfo/Idh/MocA family protein n=1 Tax=Paracidobacterium acidisoli TaxID=2303751 RepID=UPI0033154328